MANEEQAALQAQQPQAPQPQAPPPQAPQQPPQPQAPVRVNSNHFIGLLVEWYNTLTAEEQSYARRNPAGMKRCIDRAMLRARSQAAPKTMRQAWAAQGGGGMRMSYPGQPMMPQPQGRGPLRPGQSRVTFPEGTPGAASGPAPGQTIVRIPGHDPQVVQRGGAVAPLTAAPAAVPHQAQAQPQPQQVTPPQFQQPPAFQQQAAPQGPPGVQYPEPSDPNNPLRPGETRVKMPPPKNPAPPAPPSAAAQALEARATEQEVTEQIARDAPMIPVPPPGFVTSPPESGGG